MHVERDCSTALALAIPGGIKIKACHYTHRPAFFAKLYVLGFYMSCAGTRPLETVLLLQSSHRMESRLDHLFNEEHGRPLRVAIRTPAC